MPGMNGFEATKRIRQWEKETGARRIPIIALTARVLNEERQLCTDAGMDDFIAKPVSLEMLTATIGRWITSPKGPEDITS